jgi:hypothetical protein
MCCVAIAAAVAATATEVQMGLLRLCCKVIGLVTAARHEAAIVAAAIAVYVQVDLCSSAGAGCVSCTFCIHLRAIHVHSQKQCASMFMLRTGFAVCLVVLPHSRGGASHCIVIKL